MECSGGDTATANIIFLYLCTVTSSEAASVLGCNMAEASRRAEAGQVWQLS